MNLGFVKQLGEEYKIKGNYVFHDRTKSSCKIIKPNKDIFYIIGFLADGCLPKRKWKYEIEFYQKNKKLLRKISKMFEKNFEVKPRISLGKNVFRLRICSKPLYIYIKDLHNSTIKKLEKLKLSKYFISGFLDAEGSLFKTKNGWRVAITQCDADVLRKISKVLQRNNIHSKVYDPYNPKTSRKQVYYLHIEGKNVTKFFKMIPSLRFFPPSSL